MVTQFPPSLWFFNDLVMGVFPKLAQQTILVFFLLETDSGDFFLDFWI